MVRWDWKVLPMPPSVNDPIHSKMQGQPAHKIFADQHGKPIGNFLPTFDDDPAATQTTNDELPGVIFPESEESAKIPRVDGNQDYMDYMPEPDLDVGHDGNQDSMPESDLDIGHNNVDFDSTPSDKMVDATNTDPVQVPEPPAVAAGLWRSTRECHKPTNYQPSIIGKRYSIATTQLGTTYLKDETYQQDPLVAFAFLQQLSMKVALKQWGSEAEMAGQKKASQLHQRDTFVPKLWTDLSADEKSKILESCMFIVRKQSRETKARLVGSRNEQCDYLSKKDSSSPIAATESVLLTSIVGAAENRDIAIVDIPNAFIQTWVENEKDHVIIPIRGVLVDWLVAIAPKVDSQYVTVGKKGDKQPLVEFKNTIYGTMVAALLYYCKFAESLAKNELIMNPYDPCVWNKIINSKQCTICFHVDDCKISHVSVEVLDNIIAWLCEEYENVFTDSSGKMKVARGKVHKYLGMMLDFTVKYVVKATMIEYVNEIIASWDKACLDFDDGFEILNNCKKIATPAPEDVFKVDENAVKLGLAKAKVFRTIVAKALYVSKWARLDTSLAIVFLTMRVREPDENDWRRLRHLIVYLKSTRELPLVLGARNTGVLHWYVDASFAYARSFRWSVNNGNGSSCGYTNQAKVQYTQLYNQ